MASFSPFAAPMRNSPAGISVSFIPIESIRNCPPAVTVTGSFPRSFPAGGDAESPLVVDGMPPIAVALRVACFLSEIVHGRGRHRIAAGGCLSRLDKAFLKCWICRFTRP